MTSTNAWGEHLARPVHVKPVPRFLPAAVAGLCVVAGILLALAGDPRHDRAAPAPAPAATGAAPAVAFVADSAAVHRKLVFDARRARFDAAHRVATDRADPR